mgnify:CR=1 FL=1
MFGGHYSLKLKKLDLHGIKHEEVDRLVENFLFLNQDDVPLEIKKRRLNEIVELQQKHSLIRTKEFLNKTVEVLIEKTSKKNIVVENIVCKGNTIKELMHNKVLINKVLRKHKPTGKIDNFRVVNIKLISQHGYGPKET